jgi:hypothetical protein
MNKEALQKFFDDHKGLTNGELAIIANCSTDTIANWKRICNIYKPKSGKSTGASIKYDANPCYTEEWLHYHYSRRDEYLRWCQATSSTPCPHGGQGLSLRSCAELAGVTAQTISNWLAYLKIGTRSLAEAQIGEFNHRYGKSPEADQRRKARDHFFERYRAGLINIVVGNLSFSNGKLADKTKISTEKTSSGLEQPRHCIPSNTNF